MSYGDWRADFAEALDPRFYTVEYLDELVGSGAVEMIEGRNAAVIVEMRVFPTGLKAIAGVIAAGELAEIATELIPQAEALGRQLGCAVGLIESREAWGKVMKKHGYEPFQLSLVKEL